MPRRSRGAAAPLKRSPEAAKRRKRLAEISASLPEVDVSGVGPPGHPDQHLAIRVRKKTFAYSLTAPRTLATRMEPGEWW